MESQNNKRKWKSRNKNAESAEDPETQCNNLYQLLKQKAPKLTPKIIPRGFDDDNLKNLCKTGKQQEDLANYEQTRNSEGQCTICSISNTLHLDTVWSLDFSSSTYKLEKIQLICDNCKQARNVEHFISSPVPESIIQHFISINCGSNPVIKVSAKDYSNDLESILSSSEDEDSDEEEKKPQKKKQQQPKTRNDMDDESSNQFYDADGVLYAEVNQVYSIAYALKVLASNMQSLQVVDMHGNTFTEKTDIAAMLRSVAAPTEQKQQQKKKKTKTQPANEDNTTMDEEPKPTESKQAAEKKKPQGNNTNQNGKQKTAVKEKKPVPQVTAMDESDEESKQKQAQEVPSKAKKAALLKKLKAKKSS